MIMNHILNKYFEKESLKFGIEEKEFRGHLCFIF